MKKYIYILIAVFCIIFSCAFTESQKVYDKAELLTEEQIQELENKCVAIAKQKELDIVILTTEDTSGETSMAYADNFYDENKFGYETENGTGILLLIDMDNRKVWISTSGEAIKYFTDSKIESILDNITNYLSSGNYYNACITFLAEAQKYTPILYDNQPNIKKDLTPIEYQKHIFKENFLIYLIISVIAGGIGACVIAINSGGKTTVGAETYLNKSSIKVNRAEEQFIRTTITKRKIEKDNDNDAGSSTHTSSGGNTHGGGGKSF